MKNSKVFIAFDCSLVLWALLGIWMGFDEMHTFYKPLFLILALITGAILLFLKIKYKKHAFRIFHLWIVFFLLLWLFIELVFLSYYKVLLSQRVRYIIRDIYLDGLLTWLFPLILIYLSIASYSFIKKHVLKK